MDYVVQNIEERIERNKQLEEMEAYNKGDISKSIASKKN